MKKLLAIVLAFVFVFSMSACAPKTYTLTEKLVANDIKGVEEVGYVFAVSKKCANGDKYLEQINKVIKERDVDNIIKRYTDGTRNRDYYLGDLNVLPNSGMPANPDLPKISIYTSVYTPFQFSGAYGSSVDGVDMYLMVAMAESLGMNADFHDAKYADAYQAVKNGDGEILATAVVLTEQVKADFKVSDVYAKGKIQILCDEGYNFKSFNELKGFKVGVIAGRYSADLAKEELNGKAEIVEFYTDAEAKAAITNQNVDAVIMDELPAGIITGKYLLTAPR